MHSTENMLVVKILISHVVVRFDDLESMAVPCDLLRRGLQDWTKVKQLHVVLNVLNVGMWKFPLWVEANRVRLDSIILWIAGKEVKTCNQAGLNGGELPSTIHYDDYDRKS